MRKVDLPVIHKLFSILRTQYGSRFIIMIGDDPITDIKNRWVSACSSVTAEDIGKALEKLKERYPKQPPDMQEFVKFVKETKQHKPGHLSNKQWQSRSLNKCSRQVADGYLTKLRRMV